jgi:hypothetical protein
MTITTMHKLRAELARLSRSNDPKVVAFVQKMREMYRGELGDA